MFSKRVFFFSTLIFILLTLIFLPGCSSNDEDVFELTSEQINTLPILEIGDKWAIKGPSEGTDYTMTLEVTNEDVIDGKDCYVITSIIDPPMMGSIDEATLCFDKETLQTLASYTSSKYLGKIFEQIKSYIYTYSSFPYPLSVGKRWTITETESTSSIWGEDFDSEIEANVYTYEVESIEEITVPAGTFECFKVVKYDDTDSIMETSWKSPLVKSDVKQLEQDTGDVMELTGYSVSHSGRIISGGTVEITKEVPPKYLSQTIPEILNNLEIRQVKDRFSSFMKAMADKDSDAAWAICYKGIIQSKSEIDYFIEQNYDRYLANYKDMQVRESSIGKLDDFDQEKNPEISDKTIAELRGYVNYNDKAQKYFDAVFAQIENDWELLSFSINDR